MQDSRARWSSQIKLVVTLVLIGLSIYLLYRFGIVLKPLILAVVLAYVLKPAADWFQQRLRLRRGLAVLLTYLILLLALSAIPMVVIPILTEQFAGFNLNLQNLLRQIESLLGGRYYIAGQVINVDALFQQLVGSIQAILQPIFGQTLAIAIEAISSLVWIVFTVVVSFYLVKDADALHRWLENLVPPDYREDFIRLRSDIDQIWGAFFRGQLTLALIVATIFSVIGLIIGIPFALVMGILAGLLEFLPSIGHTIWLITASLLALFVGSTWIRIPNWAFMLIIIGMHLFFQQFDLNYLIPRVIGRRVHLPPLVVILGIFSGAVLAGVLGVVLASPTIASARVLARYVYANLFDQDPFPSSVAPPLPPPNPRWWRRTSIHRQTEQPGDSKQL